MKLYLDTSDYTLIQQWEPTGLIDGVTTNPTNMAKQGGEPREIIEKIFALLPEGYISVEITEQEPDKVYAQARAIAKLKGNVLVKIPCHVTYYPVIKKLVQEGVDLNITLVFSVAQVMWMAKLGVHTISPFVGRLDEIGKSGLEFLTDVCLLRDRYGFDSEILAASLRTVEHVERALCLGVDAITVSPKLLSELCTHELTDKGIAQFATDWRSMAGKRFF